MSLTRDNIGKILTNTHQNNVNEPVKIKKKKKNVANFSFPILLIE